MLQHPTEPVMSVPLLIVTIRYYPLFFFFCQSWHFLETVCFREHKHPGLLAVLHLLYVLNNVGVYDAQLAAQHFAVVGMNSCLL